MLTQHFGKYLTLNTLYSDLMSEITHIIMPALSLMVGTDNF